MKEIIKNENLIEPSYSKRKIANRLVELKSKYQDLLEELKDSSIDNIDKVFGYNNNVDEYNSDVFLKEINENLELQDKIRILKQNISTKMKNIEKINSLNLDSKSYSDLKNQISESFEIIKDSYLEKAENTTSKNFDFNNFNVLVEKIEQMQKSFDEKINKLSSNLSIKDEVIYKDEIEFLKNQVDSLLIENHECKSKLSELITISNLKEDEINKSYSAWLQNSSKLNELEYLLVDQKEKLDVLDNEKNEAIDLLVNKIKSIKNDSEIYDQFNEDLATNNNLNKDILKTIESKLDLLNEQLLNNNKKENLTNSNVFKNKYKKFNPHVDDNFIENQIDFVSNISESYSSLLNRFNELLSSIDIEIDDLIKPAFLEDIEPSFDFDVIKNNIEDVDELVNSNLENFHNSKQIFNKLQNILNVNDLFNFLKDSIKSINNLIKKIEISKDNWLDYLRETNNKIIFDNSWINLSNFINEIIITLKEIINIINLKINNMDGIDLNVLLEENMSKSNFWFCFMEAISLLNDVVDNQFDDFLSIEKNYGNTNKNNDFLIKNNEIQNELFSLINDKVMSEEEKNKKLKLVYKKLQNLEKMIDLYEVSEFEKMVDSLN